MPHVILSAVLSSIFATGTAWGEALQEQRLPDRVTDVTLYSDQAHVRREARIQLAEGVHRVAFPSLPDAIDATSVRVLAKGAKLLSSEIVRGYGEEELPPEVASRRDRLEALRRERAVLEGERAVYEAEVAFLADLTVAAPVRRQDATLPKLDAAAQQRVLDWQSRRLAAAGDRITAIDLRRVSVDDEIAVLESELAGTRGAGAALARARAVAVVEVERGANVELALVYRTYGARWVPSYDVRLETQGDKVELGVSALVWQQTDEDWRDVRLELSTAIPSQSANLPELQSWFIEEAPPPPPRYAEPSPYPYEPEGAGAMAVKEVERDSSRKQGRAAAAPAEAYGDYPMPPPPPPPPPAAPYPATEDYGGAGGYGSYLPAVVAGPSSAIDLVSAADRAAGGLLDTASGRSLLMGYGMFLSPGATLGTDQAASADLSAWGSYSPAGNAMGFDFAYTAPSPTTVPSDGQIHRVPLTVRSYPATMEHVVVPAVDESVYVRAVVENGGPYPMLAGISDVFVDGGYLGRIPTATVAAGQRLELALGRDRQVKVKRRQEQLSDRGGVTGNQKVRAYQVTVELENYHERSISVKVLDRVPYTYDEEIKLEIGEPSRPVSKDDGYGLREWVIPVPPGKKESLVFEYTLKHNKNYRVWHP